MTTCSYLRFSGDWCSCAAKWLTVISDRPLCTFHATEVFSRDLIAVHNIEELELAKIKEALAGEGAEAGDDRSSYAGEEAYHDSLVINPDGSYDRRLTKF